MKTLLGLRRDGSASPDGANSVVHLGAAVVVHSTVHMREHL
jgi:hypothetical protein